MNKRHFLHLCCLATGLLLATPAHADSLDEGPVDDTPPNVNIDSPADQATFELPETVTVSVSAADPDSGISKVWIEIDGNAEPERTMLPYEWTDLGLDEGMHTIVAKADNGEGLEAMSAEVTIAVFPAGGGTEGSGSGGTGSDGGGDDSSSGDAKKSGCSATGRDATTSGLAFMFAIFAGLMLRRRDRGIIASRSSRARVRRRRR